MVAGSPESGAPVPHGTGVLGRVVDSQGVPVPLATLTAEPDPASPQLAPVGPVRQEANVTDEHGDYFLPLPPGRWTVTVTAFGRRPVATLVDVPPQGQAQHSVILP